MYSISNLRKIFTIFLHIMLKYNLRKILEKKLFHFIKWEIGVFMKTNVMYLCTKKHEYTPKII
jgi:hypothetical protein